LEAVTKRYGGGKAAVDALSFSLRAGEFFSLLGPSGCGKTTTLRMIAGFELPDEGRILLDGRDVAGEPPYRRDVSTVFQSYALFPHLTVEANVRFGLQQRRDVTRTEADRRVSEMLALLGLQGKEARRPAQLSGGERQRVALARSLVLRPSVLLLDEPLSALDPQLRRQVRSELKQLQERLGVAFLFITHDQEEAMALSNRLGVMRAGRLEQVGTPEEVYRRPRTRFAAEFLGEVSWVRKGCGVRPEQLRLSREGNGQNECSVRARVETLEYLGSRYRVVARTDNDVSCIAEMDRMETACKPGETITLEWERADELEDLH
jgi:ABC-type Fe3+/spermidine/putrescine transport system ATPase subunit